MQRQPKQFKTHDASLGASGMCQHLLTPMVSTTRKLQNLRDDEIYFAFLNLNMTLLFSVCEF